MPRDSLRRLVDAGDRERARPSRIEPERLILAPRITTTKRICIACRWVATPVSYRELWLKANPLPRRYCTDSCPWKSERGTVEHKQWHEDLHVSSRMPPLKDVWFCPLCGGHLESVTT